MFSNTEDFPLDCDPTTTICGRSMGLLTCTMDQRLIDWIQQGLMITYADCCEDILQLVDERDETWIIDIDPAEAESARVLYEWSGQAAYE